MKQFLQRIIKGMISIGTIFIIMVSPVAAIEYTSELVSATTPQNHVLGEYTLANYAKSQQTVVQWMDKFEKWLD